MYCHLHKNQGPKKVEVWKLETDDKGDKNQGSAKSDLVSTTLPYPYYADFCPELYDTTPFNILVRANYLEDQELSFFWCFLYAYEVDGNKGFVKIRYTPRSINESHDEWSFHCNRLTKPIYPPVFNVNTAVPNAASVEKLWYAKLTRRNTRIYCSGCLELHIEWFEVPPSEVIAVIEKWSKWMRPHPCQPNPVDPSNISALRPEEEQKSKDIGRFMKGIAQLPPDGQRLENLGIGKQKVFSIAHEQ
ncbi:hypothetical protein F9C07_2062429 [Aspergillus flavus]|uniref:Bacteriophage T5 Orf172 DNA-binding domain-containing protein n=1 Tax=Aspergillus flavus (strain ATCC 200026 / FGSC A1120 / IAM 13836 / NRRL 3357 / JCM 12722 / SRRC 167) TaxID=332952 RepID=A0A7U2MWY7_ASPFN|nr:hypothetical protein F9C07_2062429 [Aspergillus flavus]